jgi:hypothetical protein
MLPIICERQYFLVRQWVTEHDALKMADIANSVEQVQGLLVVTTQREHHAALP